MISFACIALLVIAWLTSEPSANTLNRRRVRAWKRERYRLNPSLTKRRGGNAW